MTESGYYPPGTEFDPNSPWNEAELKPVQVEVTISQSLSKSTVIEVTDYIINEWEDTEYIKEEGISRTGKGIDYDFSDSDLKEAYETQEYTIPELLEYLKSYLINDIAQCIEGSSRKKLLQCILKGCEGWNVDETEVIKD